MREKSHLRTQKRATLKRKTIQTLKTVAHRISPVQKVVLHEAKGRLRVIEPIKSGR